MGVRLMVGLWTLTPSVEVRILYPQSINNHPERYDYLNVLKIRKLYPVLLIPADTT